MPTLLDQQSQRRGPVLFGRALVAAQQAEEDAVRNQIQSQREQRLANREAQMDARQQRMLEIQNKKVQLDERIFQAKTQAAEMALKMEERKIGQFSNAIRAIGKLDPRSPDYEANLGAIQAENPDIFADTGNQFGSMIKATIETQQKARNEFISGRAKEDEYAKKFEVDTGVPVPINPETGRPDLAGARGLVETAKAEYAQGVGLKPQSIEAGGMRFTAKDEERPIRQDRAYYSNEAQRVRSLAGKAVDPEIQKELLSRATDFESRAAQMDQQIQGGQPAPTKPAGNNFTTAKDFTDAFQSAEPGSVLMYNGKSYTKPKPKP